MSLSRKLHLISHIRARDPKLHEFLEQLQSEITELNNYISQQKIAGALPAVRTGSSIPVSPSPTGTASYTQKDIKDPALKPRSNVQF